MLLQRECCVTGVNDRKRNALMYAASGGDYESAVRLMGAGSHINGQDVDGNTALMLACRKGHMKVVDTLLATGNHSDNSLSTLVAGDGDTDPDERCDVNTQNKWGQTALHDAAKAGHIGIVATLVFHGGVVDAQDRWLNTPLMYATLYNHANCVAFLLQSRCSVSIANKGLRMALHTAAEKGHRGIVAMLIAADAPLDERDSDKNTPLLLAALNQHEEIVRALIRAGSDVRVAGSLAKTVLHYACSSGFVDVVHDVTNLVDDDDLDRADVNGSTPLTLAVQHGAVGIVRHLVERNCKVHGHVYRTASTQLSPLAIALRDGFTDLVPILLSAGADVNCFRTLKQLHLVSAGVTNNEAVMGVLCSYMNTPRSLEFKTRLVVRLWLGRNIQNKIRQLSIPQTLKGYILLQEELQ